MLFSSAVSLIDVFVRKFLSIALVDSAMEFEAFLEAQESFLSPTASAIADRKAESPKAASSSSWTSTELSSLNNVETMLGNDTANFTLASSAVTDCMAPVRHHTLHPDYEVWAAYQRSSLATATAYVGEQQTDYLAASVCSGTAPEKPGAAVHSLRMHHVFACDNDAAAVRFMLENPCGFESDHIFACLRELVVHRKGFCVTHKTICDLPGVIHRLHSLVAGCSCTPFSTSSYKRSREGSFAHPDVDLVVRFVELLMLLRPHSAIFENVAGFLKWCGPSGCVPLKAFLDFCEEEGVFAAFVVKLYVVNAKTYLAVSRKRLYIHFVARDSGGEFASNATERMVKARCIDSESPDERRTGHNASHPASRYASLLCFYRPFAGSDL